MDAVLNDVFAMTLLALGAYFALMIWIGFAAGRKQDHEGFVIGNRRVGFIPTMTSIAVSFRDISFIWFWFTLAYFNGYAAFMFAITYIIGLFLMGVIAPRVRARAAARNYSSWVISCR